MQKHFFYILLSLACLARAQDYKWGSVQFMQPNNGISAISRMDISSTDEKVVMGYYKNSLTVNSEVLYSTQEYGIFLAKYSAIDSLLWVKTIAERTSLVSGNWPNVKVNVQGDVFVGLTYIDTIFVESISFDANENHANYTSFSMLKFDSEGNELLHLKFDGECANSLSFDGFVEDAEENIYVLGAYGNDVWGTTDSCDCIIGTDTLITDGVRTFMVKYNSAGELLWLKKLEASYVANIETIGNSIYITGVSYAAQDVSFGAFSLEYPPNIDYGAYIAKFDTSGTFHWAKHFGVSGWDSHVQLFDIHAVSENDIVLLGKSFTQSEPNQLYLQDAPTLIGTPSGTQDAFVVCYDSLGAVKWADISASLSDDWFFNAVSDTDKNIFIAGTFSSSEFVLEQDTLSSYGSYETFITAYDSLGSHLWAKSAGGTGSDMTKGLKMDSQENLYLLGSTASQPVHFGEHTYDLSGSSAQIFMSKLVPHNIGLIEQETQAFATIYPNPNTGAFSIKSKQALTRLEIYNLLGEGVYSKAFEISLKEFEVNTALTTGLYFVVLYTEQGAYSVRKMLIE